MKQNRIFEVIQSDGCLHIHCPCFLVLKKIDLVLIDKQHLVHKQGKDFTGLARTFVHTKTPPDYYILFGKTSYTLYSAKNTLSVIDERTKMNVIKQTKLISLMK